LRRGAPPRSLPAPRRLCAAATAWPVPRRLGASRAFIFVVDLGGSAFVGASLVAATGPGVALRRGERDAIIVGSA
jgi:hypothetical protein